MIKVFNLLRQLIWLFAIKSARLLIPINTYPSWEHRHLKDILKKSTTVIDVGFNKGQFSSLALLYTENLTVYAFDPSRKSLKYASFFQRYYHPRFIFYNVGLGSTKDTKIFFEATSFDNSSFMRSTKLNNSIYARSIQDDKPHKVAIERLSLIEEKIVVNLFLRSIKSGI